jgi:hypothetical protein
LRALVSYARVRNTVFPPVLTMAWAPCFSRGGEDQSGAVVEAAPLLPPQRH